MSVEGVHTVFIPGVVSCDPNGGQSTCHLGFCRIYLSICFSFSHCWLDCAKVTPLTLLFDPTLACPRTPQAHPHTSTLSGLATWAWRCTSSARATSVLWASTTS